MGDGALCARVALVASQKLFAYTGPVLYDTTLSATPDVPNKTDMQEYSSLPHMIMPSVVVGASATVGREKRRIFDTDFLWETATASLWEKKRN
jgi:hypothetical protein